MIVRGKIVITMDGPPIENGAVAVRGDRIVDVGKLSEISKRYSDEEVVDLGEQALLPGLINAHCHLDYTCLRGKIPQQKSFTDWIRAINAEKEKLSPEDYIRSINEGFVEAIRFGTTTITNLTTFPELVSKVKQAIRTWWFAELIDVRDPSRARGLVELAAERMKSQEHWGLAPHAPFTASADLYRRCEEIAHHENILLTTHLAESREEMSMFRHAQGPLYEFLKNIARDVSDCGGASSIGRFSEIVRDVSTPLDMTKGWMLVHVNEIEWNDFDLLTRKAKNSAIVHCPRSHAYFGHSSFQYQKLRELGFNVCLGTDSLASNEDLSLFAEMRAFQKEFPDVSAEKILKMATVRAARALRQENALGRIRSGFIADLIAAPYSRSASVFEEMVAFDKPVGWLMVGGRIQNPA